MWCGWDCTASRVISRRLNMYSACVEEDLFLSASWIACLVILACNSLNSAWFLKVLNASCFGSASTFTASK